MELEALAERAPDIKKLGATLVLISPQKIDESRKMMTEKGLSAIMLSDPGNETAARYGLRHELPEELRKVYRQLDIDLEDYNEENAWTLPLPARFIIDPEGIIRHARVSADYTVRPDPEETIEALKALGSSSDL